MTIDEIHRMVVAANPVPDPDMLEPVEMPDLLDEREGSKDVTGTPHTLAGEESVRTTSRPRLTRRWPAIAAALGAVVLIAGVGLLRWGEPSEGLIAGEPPGVLDEYVAALQANDAEGATALLTSDVVDDFTPWLVGTDTSSLQVSDCEVDAIGVVRCTVDFGPNWFYSKITGEEISSSKIIATIQEEGLDLIDIPAPEGIQSAEAEFAAWVRENHPERYDEMFIGGANKYTYQSGAARSELADDYLASLE